MAKNKYTNLDDDSGAGSKWKDKYLASLKDLEVKGKLNVKCPYKCLTACKVKDARYCIALALVNSYFGDVDHGLIFCGQNAHRVNKIVTVKELFQELVDEIRAA